MNVIDGTGQIVPEPQWHLVLNDELDVEAAREYWRYVTTEMRERNILAPANRHAIRRLVDAYMIYDRSVREVFDHGAVTKPRRGNSKAIARTSPHFNVMREAGNDATVLEDKLGLSPRHRGAVTKVERKTRAARASDEFLGKATG